MRFFDSVSKMRDRINANGLLVVFVSLFVTLCLSGCGAGKVTPQPPSSSGVGGGGRVPAEAKAIRAALRYAEDANPGSKFSAVKKVVIGGWARVSVQETGVPAEEAVGFDVFLKAMDGEWEIVKTGADITSEELPDAPPGIFK
ncbi:MAG: hypothetical protein PHP64_01715 [Actinomycetota bacterium]|nr:hypothetical protein [Actinomycetota bacterium]